MKSGFALENAGWPAFLVNQAGAIIRANHAALKLFGPMLEPESVRLALLWSLENSLSADQFLEQCPSSPLPMKLRNSDDDTTAHLVSATHFKKDDQKFFIVQLLPVPAPAPAAPAARAPAPTAPPADNAPADTAFVSAHKQKLDCALQLARTVSLDFNNALTSILGHTSLILSQMEPTHPWRRSLLEVEKSAGKAAEIASDLGAFSRQEKEPRSQSSGNVNAIVQRAIDLFQNSPPKIEWSLQLGRKLFSVKFDEAKMQQAFVKILENSVQAITDQGRISVQTRNVELADTAQDRQLRLAPGTYVCVEIGDNGSGIGTDVLPRIFEPFFTTKKPPHRGLGLAWVYGIVTNHGGGVAVSSQPGAGTSVRVYLPAEKKISRDSDVAVDKLNGTETILMVDDEDLLLTMGQTVLSAFGYQVLTANSGQAALDILTKNEKPIDLVVTDMVMPGMSGRELVEHVHRVAPGTKILCSSGFVRPASQQDEAGYLQKPFTSQDLLMKVKEALAG